MEHRYSDRLTAEMNIVIYKKNLRVAMGVIKNVGSEGVFIESGFDELSVNQPLEIEFLSNEKMQKGRRLKAIVVHRTEAGFGAEIDDVAQQIKQASLLNRHPQDRSLGVAVRSNSGVDLGYASL